MPSRCCVPGCKRRGGHQFPRDESLKGKWILAVRRVVKAKGGKIWNPKRHDIVCYDHFEPSDYINPSYTYHGKSRKNRILKPTSIPAKFYWVKSPSRSAADRFKRAERRAADKDLGPNINDVAFEEVIEDKSERGEPLTAQEDEEHLDTSATQTPHWSPISIETLRNNPKMLHYYTGLVDYDLFRYVLNTLGTAAYNLMYRWRTPIIVSVENQFLITLIKLRLHTPNDELGFLFNLCDTSISNIFVTWINFMYVQWSKLPIWPTKELVRYNMPDDFALKFPSTRVILDGVEIPIEKPSNPTAQQITYSTYKNRNTLKSVVGITPGGLVSFLTPATGGSVSDRLIVERSDLVHKVEPGDSLMVDKGFNIQDIFAPGDVTVNIPTFLKQRNQLTARSLAKDRRIASKRVHVERVIGLAKTYKILCTPLKGVEIILGSRIFYICFMLCNFRSRIVPKTA